MTGSCSCLREFCSVFWHGREPAKPKPSPARPSAVQATVFGALGLRTTTALSETATLSGTRDAREASLVTGSVPSLLTGEALHAVTIGWPDQVASEASLGNLAMTVAGTGISADFVMARALSVLGSAAPAARTSPPVDQRNSHRPTGSPNQTIAISGGRVVINEHVSSAGAIVVNGSMSLLTAWWTSSSRRRSRHLLTTKGGVTMRLGIGTTIRFSLIAGAVFIAGAVQLLTTDSAIAQEQPLATL